MHRMRYFFPPIPAYAPGTYDLKHIKLRFVSVPKNQLTITNDFEKYIKPIIDLASRHTSTQLKVPADHLILPVHELQIAHIQDKFPEIEVLPAEFTVSANAQQSIRCAPCIYHHEFISNLSALPVLSKSPMLLARFWSSCPSVSNLLNTYALFPRQLRI